MDLDAVLPEKLQDMCTDAINSVFDEDKYDELNEQEDEEREVYQTELKRYVNEELNG